MNRRIIYSRPDGGVSIVIPCRGYDEGDLTDEEIFQRALSKLPQEAINPQVITADQIPTDRTFRDAWEHGGDKVQVNMDKARVIHLANIRKVRNAKLVDLDAKTMKAVGQQDVNGLTLVEATKQTLRDIPQTLDLTPAQTPDELKAIWPKELT